MLSVPGHRRVGTFNVISTSNIKMDSTPLDALMNGGTPQTAPPLPSATTYTPVMTPGTQTYSPPPPVPNVLPVPVVKGVLKNILTYVSIFLGVALLSLTPVQSLLLRYIPHAYSGSGVVSLYGAAFLGGMGVVVIYILQMLLQPLI